MVLTLSDIKPVNSLLKVQNIFKKPVKGLALKTHATSKSEFLESLSKNSEDMLIDLYKKV